LALVVAKVRRATWNAVAYVPLCLRGALGVVLLGEDEVYFVVGDDGEAGVEDDRRRPYATLDS